MDDPMDSSSGMIPPSFPQRLLLPDRRVGAPLQPVPFPADALTGPGVPLMPARCCTPAAKGCVKSVGHLLLLCHPRLRPRAVARRQQANKATLVHSLDCLQRDHYIRSVRLLHDASYVDRSGEASTLLADAQAFKAELASSGAPACYALAVSPDGKLCFSCCLATANIAVWDAGRANRWCANSRATLTAPPALTSRLMAAGLWTGGLDNTVRCWDLRESRQLLGSTTSARSLATARPAIGLAVGMESSSVEVLHVNKHAEKYQLHTCTIPACLVRVNRQSDSLLKRLADSVWCQHLSESSSVLSCDISADDRYIVTGSGDKKATLYEVMY
uniref:WD_REPEATS_REGION domain-containing protein n=1 Tax=Macrostomum lignano TaxID=282301 RepID=A0A1I8FTD0_9PLAT